MIDNGKNNIRMGRGNTILLRSGRRWIEFCVTERYRGGGPIQTIFTFFFIRNCHILVNSLYYGLPLEHRYICEGLIIDSRSLRFGI